MPVPSRLAAVLTDLSATVCQIRGLQQLVIGDDELQRQLRRTVAELESLIDGLLRTGSGPNPPSAPRSSANPPPSARAEQAFLGWLAEPTSANELLIAGGDEPVPVTQVLGELSLSRRGLAAETAAKLGLPAGTTVGHVAAELLMAVNDPAGPRCRSYRAAVSYLRDLDRGHVVQPSDGMVGS